MCRFCINFQNFEAELAPKNVYQIAQKKCKISTTAEKLGKLGTKNVLALKCINV